MTYLFLGSPNEASSTKIFDTFQREERFHMYNRLGVVIAERRCFFRSFIIALLSLLGRRPGGGSEKGGTSPLHCDMHDAFY